MIEQILNFGETIFFWAGLAFSFLIVGLVLLSAAFGIRESLPE